MKLEMLVSEKLGKAISESSNQDLPGTDGCCAGYGRTEGI